MAQPLPYERDFDFAGFQSTHPSTPLPGDKVNLELDQIAETFDQIRERIRILQRDDLQLANQSVGWDQLKPELRNGFSTPTVWAVGVDYALGAAVYVGRKVYAALVAHKSVNFGVDLAAGKWYLLADFTAVTQVDQTAVEAAQQAIAAATAANSSALAAAQTVAQSAANAQAAQNSAGEASASATAATAFATIAANSATAAAASAEAAANSADDAAAAGAIAGGNAANEVLADANVVSYKNQTPSDADRKQALQNLGFPPMAVGEVGKTVVVNSAGTAFDLSELTPDGSVGDTQIATPATVDQAVDSSKIKIDLTDTFSDAVVRLVSDKFRDVVSARDFGAFGAGNDDTSELQNFFNQVKVFGHKLYLPAGVYGLSQTLVLNNAGIPGETPGTPLGKNGIYKRSSLVGDGSGSTVLRLVGDINGIHIQTGLGRAYHRGFSIVQDSPSDRFGSALIVDQSQALHFSDIEVKGCFYGVENRDSFSISYTSVDFAENRIGFRGRNITSGSHPNAINFVSARFMSNTELGCILENPTTCNFFGGSFEGNGSGNAGQGGLLVDGPSNEGSFGVNVIGVYFEKNWGSADIRLSNNGATRIVEHRIYGCTFNRISNSQFVTNNVRVERATAGYMKAVVSENAFNGFGTYTPDVSRKYIATVDGGAGLPVLVALNNLYGNESETPV